MLDDFVLQSLLAGTGIIIMTSVMGCFILWQKMAYFGDALSHSSLLGVALGVIIGIDTYIMILSICFLFVFLLLWLKSHKVLALDSLLGILAHLFLALAVIVLNFSQVDIDLHSYLFGDILATQYSDLIIIYGFAFFTMIVFYFLWPKFLSVCLHEDLAKAEGINVMHIRLYLLLLMTIIVATSVQIIGVLLVTSLLIIPAAAARFVAKSPEQMVFLSFIISFIAVILGVIGSVFYDLPAGPSIILGTGCFFFISLSVRKIA